MGMDFRGLFLVMSTDEYVKWLVLRELFFGHVCHGTRPQAIAH
jgi:hypothetical protein